MNIVTCSLLGILIFELVVCLKIRIQDKCISKVTPATKLRWRITDSEVILWSGIGEIDEEVEYLAVPVEMAKFCNETIRKLEHKLPFVDITITFSEPRYEVSESKASKLQQSVQPFDLSSTHTKHRNVMKIPGTNLYTEVWYIIRMKTFPNGFITYTEETNDYDAHFIQIDLNPDNLPHYEKGEKWYDDVQWKFGVTEDPSWYTWDNRVLLSKKNARTTWSYKKGGGGYHVVASTNKDTQLMRAGEKWRIHALWKPVLTDGPFYKLINKFHQSGTTTWTSKKHGKYSHYIQVDTEADRYQYYQNGSKWFNDAQYSFTPVVDITASIFSFQFMEITDNFVKAHTTSNRKIATKSIILNRSFENHTEIIEESFEGTNKFFYEFEKNLVFSTVTVSYDVPMIATGFLEPGFKKSEGSMRQITLIDSKTYTVSQEIHIPPQSSVEVSVYSTWVEDLYIPFNATMIVRGTTGTSSNLSGDFLYEYLSSLGEYYHVLQYGDDYLKFNIQGKFKGTFGFRGIVSLNNNQECETEKEQINTKSIVFNSEDERE